MKITKVDNRKLAVEREQTKGGTGYLYQNKDKGNNSKEESEIKRYVSGRVRESQKLYNPFVPTNKKIRGVSGRDIRDFQQFFRKFIFKGIFINRDLDTNAKIKAIYNLDRHLNEYDMDLSSEELALILQSTLRKSWKSKKIYPTIVDIVCALSNPKTCRDSLSQIGNERLTQLIEAVMEDYLKKKEINSIVKSIENQNVKVQIVKNDENVQLELANADKGKNKILFDEMKKYSKDEAGQQQVLLHMQQALILYYPECKMALEGECRFDIANILKSQMGEEIRFSEKVGDIFATNPNSNNATTEIRTAFLDEVFSRKRNAVEQSDSDAVIYWIDHIALRLQNKYKKNRALNPGNNVLVYLIEMSWKDMIEYLGKKYIDMGKAVYHFAMPLRFDVTNQAVFGEVREEYKQGITSFDYEEIKANETIERKLSASIHFAANQFQSAVSDSEDEILSGEMKEIKKNAVKSFLRYFGGESLWNANEELISAEPKKFVAELRDYFYYLRNRYYHYNSVQNVEITKKKYVSILFSQESKLVSAQIRKKYYSNNVPMFFPERQIKPMLDTLYKKYKPREAQIPSFNNVLKRKNLNEFYKEWTGLEIDNAVPLENRKQYEGMLYFVLKEIYYYGFLNDGSAKFYFDKIVVRHEKKKGGKNLEAEKNFISAVYEAGNGSLAMVCQRIMTQYAMENNRNNLLADRKAGAQKKFDHFPLLLYKFLQEAFSEYMDDHANIYGFLKDKPSVKEMPPEESYFLEWDTNMYQELFEHVDNNQLAWYVAAHFLPQREVNQLIGSIKSYIQYISDIKLRARYAKNKSFVSHSEEKITELKEVLEILDFTLKVCLGRFSGKFDDYYWDEEGKKDAKDIYAEELAQYVQYAEANEPNKYYVLLNFCNQILDEDIRAIYTDGKNPILSRNIELARLYGAQKVIPNVVTPITQKELSDYEKLKRELQPVFDKQDQFKTEEVQKKVCKFQQMKNRIELHDVLKLAELTNDLHSYLVSLAYIRERDLLYYQLGYYYMKLQYTTGYADTLDCLPGPDCDIKKGAALYQVQAMYTYGMGVFDKNGCLIEDKKDFRISKKVSAFNEEYTTYMEGMRLFGQEIRMDVAAEIRNVIDHTYYYRGFQKNKGRCKGIGSILELYSEVYDYFFTYDKKLKKSVPVVFENILLKYNIEGVLEFGSKLVTRKNKGPFGSTDFQLKSSYNKYTDSYYTLKSTSYTYKVIAKNRRTGKKEETKKDFAVCSNTFLKQVEKLLFFKAE